MLDAVPAQQRRDSSGEAVYGPGEVGLHAIDRDPVLLGVLDEAEHFGVSQKRLGWYAAPVEADSPQGVSLNYGGLHAQLSGSYGRYIAARTGAEHHNIIFGQQSPLD